MVLMIILRYSASLQLKYHRSYDKNIKKVIFQNFQILSISFRNVTWTSLLKCLIIWKEKFAKPISMDQIAYCNQLLFILVKKLISSHEIKRNTSVNWKCLLFFYSDFSTFSFYHALQRNATLPSESAALSNTNLLQKSLIFSYQSPKTSHLYFFES